jgi:hypothetical protein
MKKTLLALALLAPITSHARAHITYNETWELFYIIPIAFLMMFVVNLVIGSITANVSNGVKESFAEGRQTNNKKDSASAYRN